MKKFKIIPIFLLLCICFGLFMSPEALALSEPEVTSPNIMLLDMNTGDVIWEQNADEKIYPASTTKIMTVLLAVEAIEEGKVALDDEVTAQASMTYDLIADGSSAGILVGETMTLENLLYCAMVSSANEACNVIAEYIGGSIDGFVRMMNEHAAELGCKNTHFTNTHGLPDDNHYSTVSDFSIIAMEAARHALFMKICDTDTIEIPATNMSPARTLNNSNALLSDNSIYGSGYIYEYAHGMKTGHTNAAGYCLISTAQKDDYSILACVFGGQQAQNANGKMVFTNFTDSITLYNWFFDNFSYQEVLKSTENVTSVPLELGADADSVNVRPASSVNALLPNNYSGNDFTTQIIIYSARDGETLQAPISAGETLGEINVLRNGSTYASVKLVAASSVELSRVQFIKLSISETLHSKPVKIVAVVLAVLFIAYLALVINYRVKRIRHKNAVRAARKARAAAQAPAHLKPRGSAETPAAPKTPQIDYFAPETPSDPVSEPRPSNVISINDATTVIPSISPAAHTEDDKAKAERDYFEEFFRNK